MKSLFDIEKKDIRDLFGSTIYYRGEEYFDEGDLGIFLEDWFLMYGEMFATLFDDKKYKEIFADKIISIIEKEDYGNENSYAKALVGLCTKKEDIELIRKKLHEFEQKEKIKHKSDIGTYSEDIEELEGDETDSLFNSIYPEICEKLNLNEEYLDYEKSHKNYPALITKLISLNRLDEALDASDNMPGESYVKMFAFDKKIEIYKKIGKNAELTKTILDALIYAFDIKYYLLLKSIASKNEWQNYLKKIVDTAEKKGKKIFLSRLYYEEKDYKKAYDYYKGFNEHGFTEMLSEKLAKNYPMLSCELKKKMCIGWIDSGTGFHYKKAGELLKDIKKLDKSGRFFIKTKNEIIAKYGKKYSLMAIVKNI
ncbi:MAG: hypothetical protein V1859_01595 [archaeon]